MPRLALEVVISDETSTECFIRSLGGDGDCALVRVKRHVKPQHFAAMPSCELACIRDCDAATHELDDAVMFGARVACGENGHVIDVLTYETPPYRGGLGVRVAVLGDDCSTFLEDAVEGLRGAGECGGVEDQYFGIPQCRREQSIASEDLSGAAVKPSSGIDPSLHVAFQPAHEALTLGTELDESCCLPAVYLAFTIFQFAGLIDSGGGLKSIAEVDKPSRKQSEERRFHAPL